MIAIGENITAMVLFLGYTIFIISILLYFSSIAAVILLILLPLILLLVLPEQTAAFLSYKQFNIIDDTVPIYNLHILLFIWISLLSVICYSEFISWYLTTASAPQQEKSKKTQKKTKEPLPLKKGKTQGTQGNIPFKPLENLLIKLENMLSKK
jgi:hypothetical protein